MLLIWLLSYFYFFVSIYTPKQIKCLIQRIRRIRIEIKMITGTNKPITMLFPCFIYFVLLKMNTLLLANIIAVGVITLIGVIVV